MNNTPYYHWSPLLEIHPTLSETMPHFGNKWNELEIDNKRPLISPNIDFGILSVSGPDAKKFLQGQITCDVNSLITNQIQFTGYCNLKGRLHNTFYIANICSDTFYLITCRDNLSHLQQTLKKYALFSKISIKDISHERLIINIYNQPISENYISDEQLVLTINSNQQLLIINTSLINKIWSELINIYEPRSPLYIKHNDIINKIPWIESSTKELFLPHSIGLVELNAISFSKGCYVGQEIVARMHYLGKIKQTSSVGVINTENVTSGQEIFPNGNIINLVQLDKNKSKLLILKNKIDSQLQLETASGPKIELEN